MTPAFMELLSAAAGRTDLEMGMAWTWPAHQGEVLQVRDAYHRLLEDELAAAAVATAPRSEVWAGVDFAQAAHGELVGLLAGLPDSALDADPGGGEWSLRQTLVHILHVERRYQYQLAYASSREDQDPISHLPSELQEPDPDSGGGGIGDWLLRLEETRSRMPAAAGAAEGRLDRPTRWAGHDLTVRFRLHRFTGHLTEHAIQCEKVLRATGRAPAEARQLARRIGAARGFHELRTATAKLAEMDARHAQLMRSVG